MRGLNSSKLRMLDQMICDEISHLMKKTLPDCNTPYHRLASWIGAISRTSAIQIFTTNYDLLMEQALEETRVPFFDGFIGSFHTFFDSYAMEDDVLPNRWVRLWKLHGSINWGLDDNGNVYRGEIEDSVPRRLIHPSHLKYDESRMMPYLAMIDRLRAFFKQPSCILITNGYSFGDQHINQIMIDGLKGNPAASIFALLYGDIDKNKYSRAIEISLGCSNLSLLAQNEAIIGTKRAPWMETREADPNGLPYAVDWIMKDDSDCLKQAQFKLGDFANFGNFLAEIVGEGRVSR